MVSGFVCISPRVYSERGPRTRWQHSQNPSNKETVVKECTANSAEKFAVTVETFATQIEGIVSWWAWKRSSRAAKIERSFSADPHPRRMISVLCPSTQEGVLCSLPGSAAPEACWAFSVRENTTNKHYCDSEGYSGRLCHVHSMWTLDIKNSLPSAALCWELGAWQVRVAVILHTWCYAEDGRAPGRAPREQLPPEMRTAGFYPTWKGSFSAGFPRSGREMAFFTISVSFVLL